MTGISSSISPPSPAVELKMIADEYAAQMNAIIDVSRSVIPKMASYEADFSRDTQNRILEQLTGEEISQYSRHLEEIAQNLRLAADVASGVVTPESIHEGDLEVRIDNATVSAAVIHLIKHRVEVSMAGSREDLMRKSLLVTAISTFEVLFGRLARVIYTVNSSALNDSDYAFSLQELSTYSSIDDAREYLIERRISALLRESVDGWDKWLKKASGGLGMDSLPVDWVVVREAFARRNLIVHAGGVVNHLYLSVLQKLGSAAKVSTGEKLSVDADYLDRAVQEILALGQVLSLAVGAKLYRTAGSTFSSAALDAARDLSMRRSWYASLAMCRHALSYKLSREEEVRLQIRYWLARRETAGIEEVQAEIEQWDTSGLADSLSHCKPLLLGDLDASASQVAELIKRGELGKFDVALDPLYEDVLSRLAVSED